ncbi:MAG: methyltransferase domain-containing protein, partial [Candidatus Brocadiia bacterium]
MAVSLSANAGEAAAILAASGVRGGLVVHLGCGDGKLTAALRVNDSYIVHGLDADLGNVSKAREHIREAGLCGPVSVERFSGRVLPYTDNLVNLLVAEDLGDVPMAEVHRVLVPNGVAYIRQEGTWTKTVKPRPGEMDEWTHYLHDPSGNAVSRDRLVSFLRQYQWTGGPRYGRHHDHMSSASAMVAAGGRVFAIFDHASPFSIQLPSMWQLVARDAFNGAVLWRRDIGPWFSQMQRLKSGPADLPRRLVAVADTVYVTLALEAPVTALDAATGKTRKTYDQTQGTDEILLSDGVLFLVVNRQGYRRGPLYAWSAQERTMMAVEAETGRA